VSKDEIFIFLAGFGVAAWLAFAWYSQLTIAGIARYPGGWRGGLGAAPLASIAGVFIVLVTAASFDVREAPPYLAMYTVLGAAWIFLAAQLMALFGISLRDDAVERRNPAAAILIMAAMAGQAALYAGGNIGDGPGWWIVVMATLVASGVWFVLWWIVELSCGVSEEVTVGRNLPMAIRLGGYMLAIGLLCGRGVAGDWVSFGNMIAEFGDAWALLPLTLAAIGIEWALRGGKMRKSVGTAIAIGALYVAAAVLAIATSPPLASSPAYDAATSAP